jgi:SAM-dependent methyltransferase
MTAGVSAGARYWEEAIHRVRDADPGGAWYPYMRRVYGALIRDWMPAAGGALLKTDLFEEAVSPQHPMLDLGAGGIGVDLSLRTARFARRRQGTGRSSRLAVADLRALPLADGSLAGVLSGSSLDHFGERAELVAGLRELARVLAPGGTLLLTLDNPHNPVVWLRNRLPFALLERLGFVPYFVGVTLTRAEAERELAATGLRVVDRRVVAHAPRAPAIWLSRAMARLGTSGERLTALLAACEALAALPTRRWTGYYLAFRAVKDAAAPAAPASAG